MVPVQLNGQSRALNTNTDSVGGSTPVRDSRGEHRQSARGKSIHLFTLLTSIYSTVPSFVCLVGFLVSPSSAYSQPPPAVNN